VRRPELIPEIEKLNVDFVGVESPELSKQIQTATGGMPISLGLDAVGGPATATLASVLSPAAHLVSYAWLSGLPIQVPQGDLIGKRLKIHGFWMYYEEYLPKIRAALTEANKSSRYRQINFVDHHNIQAVPNQRSNRTLPAWWQGSIGFQSHELGMSSADTGRSVDR
jgi:NADPH:quinone reductase-like Zn-dependent oxidoreductase